MRTQGGSSALGGAPDRDLQAGNYLVVRSLLRVLRGGNEAKAVLDSVIDVCAAMQNLRESIGVMRGRMHKEQREERRAHLLSNGLVCMGGKGRVELVHLSSVLRGFDLV